MTKESYEVGTRFEKSIMRLSKYRLPYYYEMRENPNKYDRVYGDIFVVNRYGVRIACCDAKWSENISLLSIAGFTGYRGRRHRAIYMLRCGIVNNIDAFRQFICDNLSKTFNTDVNLENFEKQVLKLDSNIETMLYHANNANVQLDFGIFIRMGASKQLGINFNNIPEKFKKSSELWEREQYWKDFVKILAY